MTGLEVIAGRSVRGLRLRARRAGPRSFSVDEKALEEKRSIQDPALPGQPFQKGGFDVRVRFWGTRGSIAKPGPGTIRYGGNTSCVEVRSSAGTLVVLDCGTGAHGLGQALLAEGRQPPRGHLLISHTHWDHIQGIPFFAPFFVPGSEWDLYGPMGLAEGLREALAGQMRHTYFPVSLDQFNATLRYHDLTEGSFQVGDIHVRTRYLNHPALTLGFRLEADGASLVFASDHEPHARRLASAEGAVEGQDRHHAAFMAGADLVIHDAQYTASEYAEKVGWGHSTVEYAMAMCRLAGVKRLALTHHDPLRDDDALDAIVADLRTGLAEVEGPPLQVFAAAEGQTLELGTGSDARPRRGERPAAARQLPSALRTHSVLVGTASPVMARSVTEALQADGIHVFLAPDAGSAVLVFRAEQPALVLLDHHLLEGGGLEACRAIRGLGTARAREVPVVVLARHEDLAAGAAAGVTDWLIEPFSASYVRTRARAWLLRTACRWQPAPVPENEEQRLMVLRGLGILDTLPEERFDRLTRLAAALFDVPTAFISLVDQDRQWLKSCHGLSLRETPREVSFCAHAILSREVTVVPDALLDPRFADNPMVVGDPRIRFYAGYPLILSGGDCVGTLCVVDTRPRHPDETAIRLLRDLGGLAEQELAAVGNSGTEHPSNDAGSSLQPHVARARSGGPYAPS